MASRRSWVALLLPCSVCSYWCAGLGAGVYFLDQLIRGQAKHLESLLLQETAQMERVLSVTQAQMAALLRTHDREFDALMRMITTEINRPPPEPEEFLPPPRPP